MTHIRRHLHTTKRIAYTAHFYTVFISLLIFGYALGKATIRSDDVTQWRKFAAKVADAIFYLARIRVEERGLEHLPEAPFILSSNHQSYLDGFIIMRAVRAPFVAVTAPLGSFPFFIQWWFLKLGYFSTARNEFEDAEYTSVVPRSEIVDRSIETLKAGDSILIFPEGTRERSHHIYPFHNGVARIALGAKLPVVPVVLKDVDRFFPVKRSTIIPCELKIEIEKPVHLHEKFDDPDKATSYIQDLTVRHLPESYAPQDALAHKRRRGVFLDLDGTISRHNIAVQIIERYLAHNPNMRDILRLTRVAFKKAFARHDIFYRSSIKALTGIPVTELQHILENMLALESHKIFYEDMIKIIDLHKKHGDFVYIITEEPVALMDPIARFFGVPIYGTDAEVKDGHFTGKIKGPIVKDLQKRAIVERIAKEQNIDLAHSFAYGNTWHDYDMLRAVGTATLVNPSRGLATHGRGMGFRVIH